MRIQTGEKGLVVESLTVMNLINIKLSQAEVQVLSLGLSYSPASNFNYTQTRIDLYKYTRKLKLRTFHMLRKAESKIFKPGAVQPDISPSALTVRDLPLLCDLQHLQNENFNSDPCDEQINLNMPGNTNFKPKSTFTPIMLHDNIDVFHELSIVELKRLHTSTLHALYKYTPQNNCYVQLMKKLQASDNIIVCQSDRGSNVELWPRELYLEEAYNQLNDCQCYKRSDISTVKQAHYDFYAKLVAWKSAGLLSQDELKFLKNDHPVVPVI